MIKEFTKDPLILTPTILGYHAEWKPPLFFWVYSIFHFFISFFHVPTELSFRLPSVIFASLSSVLFFNISKSLFDETVSFFSTIFFATSFLFLFAGTTVMMESFSLFLFLCVVYFYLRQLFLLAFIFLFLLCFVKWVYFFGVFVIGFFIFYKSNKFKDFLISLFALPFFLLIYFLITLYIGSSKTAFENILFDIFRTGFLSFDLFDYLYQVLFNFLIMFPIFPFIFPILYVFIFKRAEFISLKKVIVVWFFLFLALPFLRHYIFWYSLVVLPGPVLILTKFLSNTNSKSFIILIFSIFSVYNIISSALLFNFFHSNDVRIFLDTILLYPDSHIIVDSSIPPNWSNIAQQLTASKYRPLLLELYFPGFVFYSSEAKINILNYRVVYTNLNESTTCSEFNHAIVIQDKFSSVSSLPCTEKLTVIHD